jgi:hypothetical protein
MRGACFFFIIKPLQYMTRVMLLNSFKTTRQNTRFPKKKQSKRDISFLSFGRGPKSLPATNAQESPKTTAPAGIFCPSCGNQPLHAQGQRLFCKTDLSQYYPNTKKQPFFGNMIFFLIVY